MNSMPYPGSGRNFLIRSFLCVLLLFALTLSYVALYYAGEPVRVVVLWTVRHVQVDFRWILRSAIPALSCGESEETAALWGRFCLSVDCPWRLLFAPVALGERELLQMGVPVLGRVREAVPVAASQDLEGEISDEKTALPPAPAITEEALVALYNTHTGETYALTDGVERLNGKRGGVVKVAEALQETLENRYKIRVVRSDKIHDLNYDASYLESGKTLRKLLDEHPGVLVVLDIHRDAGKSRERSLVEVHGEQVAPVLLVVGSDARAPFPTWRQNYDFALKLASVLNRLHPGLCEGVRVKEGRYNQFLHPRALLVEVGSVCNSTEEAVRSAQLLADALAEVIEELRDDGE